MSETAANTKPAGRGMIWAGIILIVLGFVLVLGTGNGGSLLLPGLLGIVLIVVGYLRRIASTIERR